MTPIQQLMLGVGASEKTYVDEVFSNYLWIGNGSARSINNGINLSESGGMTWIKRISSSAKSYAMFDTTRGATELLSSDTTSAQADENTTLTQFNNNGFSLSTDSIVNSSYNNPNYSSWTFRKAPGFFDIVTYDGTSGSSNRTISHSLECIPGMIMIKAYEGGATHWCVYHRNSSATPAETILSLNNDWVAGDASNFGDTAPTSTEFTVSDAPGNQRTNGDTGRKYVAYLFAGGESTAATARSVEFDGANDSLSIETNSDLALGTGDFTIEFWVKLQAVGYAIFFDMRPNPAATQGAYPTIYMENNLLAYHANSGTQISGGELYKNQWYHIALSRSGTSTKLFLNGMQQGSTYSDSTDYLNGDTTIGLRADGSTGDVDGHISNVRVVKGTAVYTAPFRPPTKPLANITNTKLLCCNNSSTTGSTVTPSTITATGTSTTASTDSPFDDPAGFKFGGSNNIIKCGSYVGTGSAGLEVNLGWEPQWVMIKRATGASNQWYILDSKRGIHTGGNDNWVKANSTDIELSNLNLIDLTSTGFKVINTGNGFNISGETFVYMTIRRPDGYVGKPIEVATHAFTLVAGNSGYPSFPTNVGSFGGFPVDFALMRQPASSQACQVAARLAGPNFLQATSDTNETGESSMLFAKNNGWMENRGSSFQSWMWKRHAGMDVVTYEGNGVAGRSIPHSMNQIPEMIWVKKRNSGTGGSNWLVYHKGLNEGTNPEQYYIMLNGTSADVDDATIWNDVAPTKTHFTLGTNSNVNQDGDEYIAMLFASVPGISQVGYFSGSDSSHTITTGFQPRWALFKNTSGFAQWVMADTLRGWTNGSQDLGLYLSHANAHTTSNIGHPVSNGLYLDGDNSEISKAGQTHIYYTHA